MLRRRRSGAEHGKIEFADYRRIAHGTVGQHASHAAHLEPQR